VTQYSTVTGRHIISILEKLEFKVIRVRGSHHFLRHADGRTTVIPVHAREDIGPGLLGKILREVGMSREDFQRLL
jgi:predicted RNA binding protein YcfA (HicA-like mRNA interferase family)